MDANFLKVICIFFREHHYLHLMKEQKVREKDEVLYQKLKN